MSELIKVSCMEKENTIQLLCKAGVLSLTFLSINA
jgi:hypothetical protein